MKNSGQSILLLVLIGIGFVHGERVFTKSKEVEKEFDVYSMTQEEFEKNVLNKGMGSFCRYDSTTVKPDPTKYPEEPLFEMDWRNIEALYPPKNQSFCPSSWAWAAVAAVEAHESILTGNHVNQYSIQQILDCIDTKNDQYTCGPGSPTDAYNYVQKAGGLSSKTLYPLKLNMERDSTEVSNCKFRVNNNVVQVSGGSKDIHPYDEVKLITSLLMEGPITVLIDARYLKDYKGGIWNGASLTDSTLVCSQAQEDLNHAVLIIGYEKDEATGKQFYIAMNSWGTQWGEKGYFRFEREMNFCGMTVCASFPKIKAF